MREGQVKDKKFNAGLHALMAQTDLKGWRGGPETDKPDRKDPKMQHAVLEDLREEFYRCLEDCVKQVDPDRFLALLTRAERLTRLAAEGGYDLLQPLHEHWAAMLYEVHRSRRRFLLRKYFTNPDSVNPDELAEALDLYPEDSAEHQEDLEKVRAKMADPSFRMCSDTRAKAKAIALRPLHDRAYMRKLFGLDA
jgi:hypothetical protein